MYLIEMLNFSPGPTFLQIFLVCHGKSKIMKTIKYLFLLTICSISLQIQAQFSFGVKTGITRAWEDYGDVEIPEDGETHVYRFNVSGLAYYQFSNYFSFGAEPGYVERGAACEPGFIIFNQDTKLFLNYVEMPLMLAGNLPLFKNKIEVFGKMGYGASFITTAFREVSDFGSDAPPEKTKLEFGENATLNRWDHGIYSGAGFGFNFGKNQIFLETDYYFGLKDAEKFNTSKNRSLNFNVGYLFQL